MNNINQLAIIKNIEFGWDNTVNQVTCRFQTFLSENDNENQVLLPNEIIRLLEDYQINNIKQLENQPCWVSKNKVFIKLCKI